MRYRGVLQLVLYSHLREDASSYPVSQFHDTEIYMPGDVTFPLVSAAEAAFLMTPDSLNFMTSRQCRFHLWILVLSQKLVEFM